MKHTIFSAIALLSLATIVFADKGRHHKDPNGKHAREGYLHNNGKPCPCPDKPCARPQKPCARPEKPCAWKGRCVGHWEKRPCGMCPAPGCTPVTVNNTCIFVPTSIVTTAACVTTVLTTVVPTIACTTFVIPGANNPNCRGERNDMVEKLISSYAKSDAMVFLNGQEIVFSGSTVVSGSTVNTIIRTGVVTVTGADANAAPGEHSMAGTLAAIMLMAGAALFI